MMQSDPTRYFTTVCCGAQFPLDLFVPSVAPKAAQPRPHPAGTTAQRCCCPELLMQGGPVARRYESNQPPSTSIVVPVTKSFCTRNTMPCATSSGLPARGIRFFAVMFL